MNKERLLQHLHGHGSSLKTHPNLLHHPLLKHLKLNGRKEQQRKTSKRHHNGNKKKGSTRKRLLSDDEITNICVKGQFDTYEGSLYGRLGDKKYKVPTEGGDLDKYIQRLIGKMELTNERKALGDDFYTYINKSWLNEELTQMEKSKTYYVQIDIFRIKQDEVYHKLTEYTETFLKKDKNTQKAKCIRNLYESFKHTSEKTGLMEAKQIKDKICDMTDKEDDLYDLLGEICSNEIISFASPVAWSISPDEKDVSKYISHLNVPKLGLYDVMLYIDTPTDDTKTKQYKKVFKEKYIKFIGDTFKTCLPDSYKDYNPHDVWQVEYDMLMSMGTYSDFKQDPNFYNVATQSILENKVGFNWTKFAKRLGYSTVPQKIIVSNLNATKGLVELMHKNWNTKAWKTYWIFIHLKQLLRFVVDWRPVYFNFYRKFVKGQPVDFTADIYSIFGMSLCFNKFLTDQYMLHNENQQYITYATNLFNDLRSIFKRRIEMNTWLSPSTKKGALKKLEKIKVTVGTPSNIPEDPLLDYTNDNAWRNAHIKSSYDTFQFISLEGKGIVDSMPTIDWIEFKLTGSQAYLVNAYYTSTSNSIHIPMGILQPPFIDLNERGIEYNLANLGYTLGHELSHSLDNTGSKYDEDGNLNDWWTDADRKIFNKKVKDVIIQYESAMKRDGIIFDASISVGEDLADIVGLSLLEDYLIDFHHLNDDIDLVKKLSFESLYIYLAATSRQEVYKRALPAQLKQNPHPLNKYRVNCPISRLKFFKSVFKIEKKDHMWWHNSDVIW
jgi:putative endopeptidase